MKLLHFRAATGGLLLFVLWGCSSYKQNIMLKTPDEFKSPEITREMIQAERNYVIKNDDMLNLEVYSNKGERIIDPNPQLSQSPAGAASDVKPKVFYLVDLNGMAKFPVVGELKMEGLTLRQAETILQTEYEKYFKESYVVLTFENKRVIVLGAPGGQVIPLINQNVTLAEVLAMAKGLSNESKANNIKIVRHEKIYQVDFSTSEGFLAGNMIIEPGDIIYVEPVRRPFAEGLRDYIGLMSLVISAVSLIIVISSLN